MNDLTSGKEWKLILKFALPMLLGNVFQQLYNFVDSIIVGKFIDKEALAAVGASSPVIWALIAFIIGIGSGFGIVISQAFGAGNITKVKRTITTMYLFLFASSVVFGLAGVYYVDEIFTLMNLPADVLPDAKTYFTIYSAGIISFFGFNGTAGILRGLGDSKTPLNFLILASVLNILLDLLFILYFNWGVAGAAYATIIAQMLAFIISIVYLYNKNKVFKQSLKNIVFDKLICLQSLKIGVPTGLQQTFVAVGMTAIVGIVNGFGVNVIAAYSAAIRIDSLAILPAMNFSSALATFSGQNYGAKRFSRIRAGFISTTIMSIIFCLVISLIILIFGEDLMSMFTNDAAIVDIGMDYLVIVTSFYLIISMMFSIHGVLRGVGATFIPMIITFISLWLIRIPCAHFLSLEMGSDGIWWSIPCGWTVGLILSYLYYISGKWNKLKRRNANQQ